MGPGGGPHKKAEVSSEEISIVEPNILKSLLKTDARSRNFEVKFPNNPETLTNYPKENFLKSRKIPWVFLIGILVIFGIFFSVKSYGIYKTADQMIAKAEEQRKIILIEAQQKVDNQKSVIESQDEQIRKNSELLLRQQKQVAAAKNNELDMLLTIDHDINNEIRNINQIIYSTGEGPEHRKNFRIGLLKFNHVLKTLKSIEKFKGNEVRAHSASMIDHLDSQSFPLKEEPSESWFDISTLNYFITASRNLRLDMDTIIQIFNNAFGQCLEVEFIKFPEDKSFKNYDELLSKIREAVLQLEST